MSEIIRQKVKQMHRIAFLFLCVAVFLYGCGTLGNIGAHTHDAIAQLDPHRIYKSASNALLDPNTLIPFAGAAAFRINHLDKKFTRWASSNNPVFGSRTNASESSDLLLRVLEIETILTCLIKPAGNDIGSMIFSKAKDITVEYGAFKLTTVTTEFLKDEIHRTRPDGSDRRSFPSGHSSAAFSLKTLTNRNLDSTGLPGRIRIPLKVGNMLIASAVSWARLEGEKHYPSDVLAGAALGYFISAFLYDAFLLPDSGENEFFFVFPSEEGIVGGFRIMF